MTPDEYMKLLRRAQYMQQLMMGAKAHMDVLTVHKDTGGSIVLIVHDSETGDMTYDGEIRENVSYRAGSSVLAGLSKELEARQWI